MSLIKQRTMPNKDEWSLRCARRLHEIVTQKMRRVRKFSATSWKKEFERLRASLDGNEKVVEETLDWYENNWERVKAKPACAGSWCHEKLFNLMRSMMEQDNVAYKARSALNKDRTIKKDHDDCSNKRLRIPEDVRAELDEVEWRGVVPVGVEDFYLETYDAAKRLLAFTEGLEDPSEERSVMENFLHILGTHPEVMSLRWCRWVAIKSHELRRWRGDLGIFALEPENWFFQDRLMEYRGVCIPGTMNRLFKALHKAWS